MTEGIVAFLAALLVVTSNLHLVSAQCCSQNFKDCDAPWCANCACQDDVIWLPGGAITGCIARWEGCFNDVTGCCNGLTCVPVDQNYSQCRYEGTPTTTPPTAAPTPPPPTATPTTSAPTTTPAPTQESKLFSCSSGIGKTTWEALLEMENITYEVSSNPIVLSIVASGGAAGSGGSSVSEGQGYGVLTAALALLSMNEGDSNYDVAKRKFEGYFNGWKKMCVNSNPPPCQNPKYCDGGNVPCLPGWKHAGDLGIIQQTGAAPDADEDAIVGMIIAVKAVANDTTKPSWYDEVLDWADRSCTQFLQDNTVLSNSGEHRLLKLGSCWGGWDSAGNNPSYPAPGHFRMMRDFQASITSRSYSLPSFGDTKTLTERWNSLIDTTYKFYETTQCPDTGLVPNWALVKEVHSNTLAKKTGQFSGSGTPQYEFGSEASRTMWRVAFDAAAYPEESLAQAGAFLAPLQVKMVENFSSNFGQQTLQDCSGNPGYVSNVFGSWQNNGFIYGPVYSTLVSGIPEDQFLGKSFSQQAMVDEACSQVSTTDGETYFGLSWLVIAQMTLNGEVAKAGELFNGGSQTPTPASPTPNPSPAPTISPTPIHSPAPTMSPTRKPTLFPTLAPVATPSPTPALTEAPVGMPSPTPAPTDAPVTPQPTPSPTMSPTPPQTSGGMCCSSTLVSCMQSNWCNALQSRCEGDCGGFWTDPSANTNCIALHGTCTNDQDGCCSPAVCEGGQYYRQCKKP